MSKTVKNTYGSVCVHSRLGPRTMAMLPGVILLESWYSLSLAKNLIRYLRSFDKKKKKLLFKILIPTIVSRLFTVGELLRPFIYICLNNFSFSAFQTRVEQK